MNKFGLFLTVSVQKSWTRLFGSEGNADVSLFGDGDDLGDLDGEAGRFFKVGHWKDLHSGSGDQYFGLVDFGALFQVQGLRNNTG